MCFTSKHIQLLCNSISTRKRKCTQMALNKKFVAKPKDAFKYSYITKAKPLYTPSWSKEIDHRILAILVIAVMMMMMMMIMMMMMMMMMMMKQTTFSFGLLQSDGHKITLIILDYTKIVYNCLEN